MAADGVNHIRTKNAMVSSTERPPPGGAAPLYTTGLDSRNLENLIATNVMTFTLAKDATIYISGSIRGLRTQRWFHWWFQIPVSGGIWRTDYEYPTNMFWFERDDSRDNFDVVSLPSGTYQLYVVSNFFALEDEQMWVEVLAADHNGESTMIFEGV